MIDRSTTDTLQERQDANAGAGTTFTDEGRLLRAVAEYLRPEDVQHVQDVLSYAHELRIAQRNSLSGATGERMAPAGKTGKGDGQIPSPTLAQQWDREYVISVAETLAETVHIDAISLAAVLLYQAVESGLVSGEDVGMRLGGEFGVDVAQTIENIARFDSLQRPGAALRRNALVEAAEAEEPSRERRRSRERQRQQDIESLRKMFVAMSEDPRVAVFKIADQLRLMRAVRIASDTWRTLAGKPTSRGASDGAESVAAVSVSPEVGGEVVIPAWSEEECRLLAAETRDIYAPLAGRLGMGRVEGELDDLAFAVLDPDEYHWLSDAVAEYTRERGTYIERVCTILRNEMRSIGLNVEVSGRAKHLYSIYKKVQRTESHDLSNLYDILAFRIIVDTVADCYLALGHVHALWRPKDGRIKDFIANPKPNGYRSLHTTVFCLDNLLAEIQIRTHEMHEVAEYGVAMHWYYKDVGDSASGEADSLQGWVNQVQGWQQELQATRRDVADRALEAVKGEVLKEQIFVFTPAGDVKQLPAGAMPLDFAYLVHTDVGNQVAGVRVASSDGTGRLVRKLVPLDYELKNGDVVEIIKRKDAHPTRDWLHLVRTKSAHDRIMKYLKAHERDIDLQMGRERLDRELRAIGVRKGYDDLSEEDIEWVVEQLEQRDQESLLVAIGSEKLRSSVVIAKLRERLFPAQPAEAEPEALTAPTREMETTASVAGLPGMLTRIASCCNPLPGDELMGFITRGRGVVIHRADCPNLLHLLQREPERAVAVEWPKLDGQETFRAPIVIEALDRTGLLADVTGVITSLKINMLKVNTVTKPAQHRAIITATLEIHRPEQLNAALKELRQVPSVENVDRKKVSQGKGAPGKARAETKHARKG
jgi:GTP diphosphokinase / guanosine-3',5'-bis(diphosphate) 3'-diphosphatase